MTETSRELRLKFERALNRAKLKVLRDHPKTLAIVVNGSVGRGEEQPHSDIDLLIIVRHGPKPELHSYFDQGIYVSPGFVTLREFRKWDSDYHHFFWVRGGARSGRVIHDPEGVVAKIVRARCNMKTPHHILEDALEEACTNIIEYSGKLRNGWKAGDEYLTRYAARVVAEYAEKVVIALNDLSPISENIVWHQVLKATLRPRHFRIDYPLALGLKATGQTGRVYRSALRLAYETLSLVNTEFGQKARARAFRVLLEDAPAQFVQSSTFAKRF